MAFNASNKTSTSSKSEMKFTSDQTATSIPISTKEETVTLEEPKAEKKQEESKKEEKPQKEALVIAELINAGVRLALNQITLKDSPEKLTLQEVSETKFGHSIEAVVNLYFPNLDLNHPLILLGASSATLLVLINKKQVKKTKENDKGKEQRKGKSEGEDLDNAEKESPAGNIGASPYATISKIGK